MIIFSAVLVAILPFLLFFNSLKLYKNIKLVKLAAKGFIETVIFMIALGLNNDYSLRHLDEYERQSFLDGEG